MWTGCPAAISTPCAATSRCIGSDSTSCAVVRLWNSGVTAEHDAVEAARQATVLAVQLGEVRAPAPPATSTSSPASARAWRSSAIAPEVGHVPGWSGRPEGRDPDDGKVPQRVDGLVDARGIGLVASTNLPPSSGRRGCSGRAGGAVEGSAPVAGREVELDEARSPARGCRSPATVLAGDGVRCGRCRDADVRERRALGEPDAGHAIAAPGAVGCRTRRCRPTARRAHRRRACRGRAARAGGCTSCTRHPSSCADPPSRTRRR